MIEIYKKNHILINKKIYIRLNINFIINLKIEYIMASKYRANTHFFLRKLAAADRTPDVFSKRKTNSR